MTLVDFSVARDGRPAIFIDHAGTVYEGRRPLAAPFQALRVEHDQAGRVFILDTEGRLWTRLADAVEYLPNDGRLGSAQPQRRTAQWQRVQ